jgi:hypothetical protein
MVGARRILVIEDDVDRRAIGGLSADAASALISRQTEKMD